MPLTDLENELRVIARERIASGELPCIDPPLRMWGGYGSGQVCAVCDKTIRPAEVEFEVEESVDGQMKQMWFHTVCQSIWQLECARVEHLKKHPTGPANC